jgi:hypothetical protein
VGTYEIVTKGKRRKRRKREKKKQKTNKTKTNKQTTTTIRFFTRSLTDQLKQTLLF